jgi:hypothetical protein
MSSVAAIPVVELSLAHSGAGSKARGFPITARSKEQRSEWSCFPALDR